MRIFWLLCLLSGWFSLPAQTFSDVVPVAIPLPAPDPRLFEAFDSAYVFAVQKSNPTLLLRWNFYLDNAFLVSDFPAKKGEIATLPVVRIANTSSFNIFVLEREQALKHDWLKPVFYRINDSEKVLMYLPGQTFVQRFRAFLDKKS